ncbi:male sterility protein-domain-containing protein [Xylariomycetidae sp. FL0641]|nr:male sterility protein-domain-containing protein [Xylariomycetidae sp. FL0641]
MKLKPPGSAIWEVEDRHFKDSDKHEPHVIDSIADAEPTRECFSIPRSSEPASGWEVVTFQGYANAVNHIAHWIVGAEDFIINSEMFGAEWRKEEGEEAAYRLVVVRKDKHPGYQGFFYTFPDAQEHDTKDLYRPHPHLPDHWMHIGRSDSVIVLSNGEKLNPVAIERIIGSHPEVRNALVFGAGRFQPGVLVDPVKPSANEDVARGFIDGLWPLVEEANGRAPRHGQITRQFVLLSDPARPFVLAGKGTVQKGSTLKQYATDIEQVYLDAENAHHAQAPSIIRDSDDGLLSAVVECFRSGNGSLPKLEPDTDFFSVGVDSLQVVNAALMLRAGLKAAGSNRTAQAISSSVIYQNPTPRKLANYLYVMSTKDDPGLKDRREQEVRVMRSLWQEFTRDLPGPRGNRSQPRRNGSTVLLTGSTGMLGSYLLDALIRSPSVEKVVCLNRAENGGRRRQVESMQVRGLSADFGSKVEFWHADLANPTLGLGPEVFDRLLRTADLVIHNAWPVNFNLPIEAFAPQIRGVRNLANLASEAGKRVNVVFVSSASSVGHWESRRGPVPEDRLEELGIASRGYGQSKLVGSLVLDDAARAGNFTRTVLRIGQIAGPEHGTGRWNTHEWFPSLIASSPALGTLPADLGAMDRLDWVPCDRVAAAVLEIAGVDGDGGGGEEGGGGYYNLENPHPDDTWRRLAPAVGAPGHCGVDAEEV